MKLKTLLFIIFLCFHEKSYSWDYLRYYQDGLLDFELKLSGYKAFGNFSSSGQLSNLLSGEVYNLVQIDAGFRWNWTEHLALRLGSQFASAESSNLGIVRRNSTVTEANFGFDYLVSEAKILDFGIDFNTKVPFRRVEPNDDRVLNHEGALEVQGVGFFRKTFDTLAYQASLGYRYRDEGRSSQLPYSFVLNFLSKNSLWGLGVSGAQALCCDIYGNNRTERDKVRPFNGQALKFYSVEPSYTDLILTYKNDSGYRISFFIDASYTVLGSSYAAGYGLSTGINYRWDLESKPQSKTYQSDDFEEYDGEPVDQNLFENDKQNQSPTKKKKNSNNTDSDVKIILKKKNN
jgi:hypothetical protein